jgi:hypothetical protein
MPKRRKTRPSGVLTVLVIVGGAVFLILFGNWLKGAQPRRVPAGEASLPSAPVGEIQADEKRQLEGILEKSEHR